MEFGVIKEKKYSGLFGCTMTWILEILPHLKKNNIYPEWIIDTYCYGMIIPELLIPKKITSKSQTIESLTNIKTLFGYKYKKNEFKIANELFFEYFNISNDVLKGVELYERKFIGKTLGIHYRGTDKLGSEAEYISIDNVLNNIINFLNSNTYNTIFIISDEEIFITKILETISNKEYNLVFTDSKKSKDNNPIHLKNCNINDAKNALIDSLLLSKCNYVIKTSSCLSDWVKIWNPDIEVYNLNKFKYDWFPQSAIPVKSYL
jgi:hypothetical protein